MFRAYPGLSIERLCSLGLDLAKCCSTPPTSLFVVATHVPDVPYRLGSGADIYTGIVNNQKVLVKRLRYFLNMPHDEKVEVEEVSFTHITRSDASAKYTNLDVFPRSVDLVPTTTSQPSFYLWN